MKRLLLAVGFCLGSPAVALGQAGDFAARVDTATLAAVQPILDAAVRDSLPVHALESKVLEGVAKNRPAAQIGRVVASLADEFRGARRALREGLPDRLIMDGEVVAAAMAARRGIAPEIVQSLWASKPDGDSLEIPLTVLSELVRRGVPIDEATAVVAQVVSAAVPMQLAAQIPGKVDGALASGSPPAAALAEALRTLNIPAPAGRRPNE